MNEEISRIDINNVNYKLKDEDTRALGEMGKQALIKVGYYVCSTPGSTATKTINATDYTLSTGGCIKVKMDNANTVNDATLNINSTGAKPLYYAGERASANNSWDAGETVEVYYDGTNFYANNVAGGSGSGDGAFDVSAKYPTSGVEGGNTYTLAGALAVLNANLSAIKKKGGMSIKFVQSSDNRYVQYRLMSDTFNTTLANWQGVDDWPTAGSNNLVKSGGVYLKINQEKQRAEASEQNLQESVASVKEETLEESREMVNSILENYAPIEIHGDVNNAADEEDLTSVNVGGTDVLKFKDKVYNPITYSGLGRKYLRKNMVNGVNTLTQSMINQSNTIYVIMYDFTLGEDITIPAGCTLEFDGGSISGNGNGKNNIIGNSSNIDGKSISLKGIYLSGTWKFNIIYSSWFDDINDFVKSCNNSSGFTIINLEPGNYTLTEMLSIPVSSYIEIRGNNSILNYNRVRGSILNIYSLVRPSSYPQVTMTTTYSKGDYILTNNGLQVSKDNILLIKDEADYSFSPYRDYRQGEFVEVANINDNQIELKHGISGNYLNSGNITLRKVDMASCVISDLTLNIHGDYDENIITNGLVLQNLYNSTLTNVKVLNADYGIYLAGCYGLTVTSCTANCISIPNQNNYGIFISNCQNVVINQCNSYSGNHGISIGGDYDTVTAIINRFIQIKNCVCSNYFQEYLGGIETHGNCEYFTFENNYCNGIGLAGNHGIVRNNKIFNVRNNSCGIGIVEATGFDFVVSDNWVEGNILISPYYKASRRQNLYTSSHYTMNDDVEEFIFRGNTIKYDRVLDAHRKHVIEIEGVGDIAKQHISNKRISFYNNNIDGTITHTGDYAEDNYFVSETLVNLTFKNNVTYGFHFVFNDAGDLIFCDNKVTEDKVKFLSIGISQNNDLSRHIYINNNEITNNSSATLYLVAIYTVANLDIVEFVNNTFFCENSSKVNGINAITVPNCGLLTLKSNKFYLSSTANRNNFAVEANNIIIESPETYNSKQLSTSLWPYTATASVKLTECNPCISALPASAVEGSIKLDKTNNKLKCYINGAWKVISVSD